MFASSPLGEVIPANAKRDLSRGWMKCGTERLIERNGSTRSTLNPPAAYARGEQGCPPQVDSQSPLRTDIYLSLRQQNVANTCIELFEGKFTSRPNLESY